jgi:CBS domain-containing protein
MSEQSSQILQSEDGYFLPVRQLLHSWSLEQYLATRPPCAVLTLPASCTCANALRTLATHNVSSAPVFDGKQYIGFFDVVDILKALLTIVNVRELTEENKEFKLRAVGMP